MTKTYKAVFERDEDVWLVHVPQIRGCHTYGRTLDQTRRRLREALSLWVDDAYTATLDEEIRLPAEIRAAVERSRRARARADRERARAADETERTARVLLDEAGIGMRDAGELLGLSHQRVQQLVRR